MVVVVVVVAQCATVQAHSRILHQDPPGELIYTNATSLAPSPGLHQPAHSLSLLVTGILIERNHVA